MKIAPEILAILNACRVDGNTVYIESGQLDRKTYEAVNKVLELIGGKWNRKAKGHVFDDDPAGRLECAILTGDVLDERKAFQFFETPLHLARRMAEQAAIRPGERILEPSAGTGRLLDAVTAVNLAASMEHPWSTATAIELNPARAEGLRTKYARVTVIEGDFLQVPGERVFDVAIMNPPFGNRQDIRHILHALAMLKPGGRLVGICGNGPRQNDQLRPLIERMGGDWEALPPGTFKESGTGVNAALISVSLGR